jgi:hypothetical protein
MRGFLLGLVVVVVCGGAVGGVRADWNGTLSTGSGIIDGGTYWTPVSLAYSVVNNHDGTWTYSYNFINDATGQPPNDYYTSDILVETGSSFGASDYLSTGGASTFSTYTLGTYDTSNFANLPGSLYGLDFNGFSGDDSPYTVTFTTDTAPVLGDFYADSGGDPAYGYDTGFTGPSATINPFSLSTPDGTLAVNPQAPDQILVPGDAGDAGSAPEPGSLALGLCALGAVMGGAIRRRKKAG